MRIGTNFLHRQGMITVQDAQSVLARTQLQLSTGRRLLQPADDPAGATQAADINELLASQEQYRRNASAASTRLEYEESRLSQATDLLQRVRDLAVQGLNDSAGAQGRRALAIEVRQRLQELLAVANGADQNGDYLFAGTYSGSTSPFVDAGAGTFTYNGDQNQRLQQISETRRVADSDHGVDVFMRISTGSGVQSAFRILYSLSTALDANAPTQASLNDLDAALQNMLRVRAQVGARQNAIDTEVDSSRALDTALQGALSRIQDVDYAEAVTRLNQQLAGLQAAQQTYLRVQGQSLFDFL
jgi:flagellar hook-associated protein 3 FlgL